MTDYMFNYTTNGTNTIANNVTISTIDVETTTVNNKAYLPKERLAEGLYLMILALGGISLNLMIISCMFMCKSLRTYINGFILHGCLLDVFKSALCIPYSLAVLQLIESDYCNIILGLAYVVTLTVSMFNLLAMVMAEAYVFHEHNVSSVEESKKGATICVIFGIATIYVGSIILHLGPTLIGGEFQFNKDIGNCTFAYGEVQHYIVQVIWVIIMTITLIIIFRYIHKFYCQLKANQRFRITNLARNAAAYSKGEKPNEDIYELIHKLKKRVKVLLFIALIYTVCWYPLFFLTLTDYSYEKPGYLYRIMTIIAWSHCALVPTVLLSMDHNFGLVRQIRQTTRRQNGCRTPHSPSTQPLTRDDSQIYDGAHASLYNNTMGYDGRARRQPDTIIVNPHTYESGRGETVPTSPAKHTTSSSPMSNYDSLPFEECPL